MVVSGTPADARCKRDEPHRIFPAPVLERMIRNVLPRCRVLGIEPLAGGLRNTNFKVHLHSAPEPIVLRIYRHDISLCRKEMDIMRLIGASVPVPEVIGAKPGGLDDTPPFLLMRYVEGLSFLALKRSGDTKAMAEAAYSAGKTLAAISRFSFPQGGWLASGRTVTKPLLGGANPMLRFLDGCLGSKNLQERMSANLRNRIGSFVWSWATQLAELDSAMDLVHGDFSRRNLLVRSIAGHWTVAAVLDWEFAVSGTPLIDFGNFLRYEQASLPVIEPHFSTGYLDGGGTLPEDWRILARVIDLFALCESLTHDQLPENAAAELIKLIRTTIA